MLTSNSAASPYFQPQYPVRQDGNGWVMQLPNAEIRMPKPPAWLQVQNRQNAILAGCQDPDRVRSTYDRLTETAQKSYDSTSMTFRDDSLKQELHKVSLDERKPLVQLFEEDYKAEMESTHRVGGSMAGARCRQMRIFSEILSGLRTGSAA